MLIYAEICVHNDDRTNHFTPGELHNSESGPFRLIQRPVLLATEGGCYNDDRAGKFERFATTSWI